MKEWFEDWFDSPYYHLLYQNRSDEEATHFVNKITERLSPNPNATLLDLACGKGRHARAFSLYQLDVTGLDLSPQSIEYAKQFENDHLHFYVHDMRNVFRTNYFEIVCNLFTSFGYFKSNHDNHLAARSMAQALKKGGTLIIDFVNKIPAQIHNETFNHETKELQGVHFEIHRSYTEHKLIKSITINDNGVESQFVEQVNSFTFEEMNALFTETGLQLISTFGNYAFEPYDAHLSPRMILVYTK
jgi:SAM-dependent methyltransferase